MGCGDYNSAVHDMTDTPKYVEKTLDSQPDLRQPDLRQWDVCDQNLQVGLSKASVNFDTGKLRTPVELAVHQLNLYLDLWRCKSFLAAQMDSPPKDS